MKAQGGIDLLVCNPAYSRRGAFLEYDPAVFQQVLRGTLEGAFHLSQLAAREMVRQGRGGKIVFISSVQAEMPLAGSVAYNAAKAGLNHMARTIAAELAVHRINVNVIEPGWIDTPGERGTFTAAQIEQAGARLPWGRLGTPQDIGRAAAFLCSDGADYITGSVLAVDGGFRLRLPRRSDPAEHQHRSPETRFLGETGFLTMLRAELSRTLTVHRQSRNQCRLRSPASCRLHILRFLTTTPSTRRRWSGR